jgi:hypothetical protein
MKRFFKYTVENYILVDGLVIYLDIFSVPRSISLQKKHVTVESPWTPHPASVMIRMIQQRGKCEARSLVWLTKTLDHGAKDWVTW